MSEFGWIPEGAAPPQTTAKAVPQAVTSALKTEGMAPFPRTAMLISSSIYGAVIGTAGDILRGTGIPYRTKQLSAELTSRGYRITGAAGAFGQAGMEDREAAMARARARTRIAAIKSKGVLIGVAVVAVVVIALAVRSEKRKGR